MPAEFAVGLKLNPAALDERRSERQVAPRTIPAQKAAGLGWKTRCRRIALEANDARHILQTIEEKSRPRATDQHAFVAPRTDVEEMLCKIWEEFLRVKRVGVHDDFFELGGHSLLAVRLFAEVEKQTGRKLPLVTIFQ